MTTTTYKRFRQAILGEKQVTCLYGGHYRELCPHIIGFKDGKEKVLAFQFAGESATTLPKSGQWRCLYLSDVSHVRLRSGPWHAGSGHSTQQRCVDIVDLDINVHVRKPRRR
jgi:hypothetical protein